MPFFRFSSHRSLDLDLRIPVGRNSSTGRSRSISLKFALQLTMWPFCLFMHNNICQAFHKQLHQCSSIGAREAERAIQRRRRRRRRRCVESCCTVRTLKIEPITRQCLCSSKHLLCIRLHLPAKVGGYFGRSMKGSLC